MSLPTSGSIGWEYTVKALPSPRSDENGVWYVATVNFVPGVKTRTLYNGNQQQPVGTWQYNRLAG